MEHTAPTTLTNNIVLARLDRAIHLPLRRAARWIPRLKRGKAFVEFVLLTFLVSPAFAGPMPEADYRAAMTGLDEIETLVTSTTIALQKGMTQADARVALPHLQERLQWMRDIKVGAGRYDTTTTLRKISNEHKYAHCIIMRAGLLDETFQDVMVNVSMKAGGTGDEKLLPMKADAIAALGTPAPCSRW